jgi:septum site-determining protein MinC
VSSLVRQRQSLTFRARSYMAFAFTPQPPIADWLVGLDATLQRSKGFFAGHPVVLDLSAAQLNVAEIAQLIADLQQRNIRVLGIEGIEPTRENASLPPILRGGRIAQEAPQEAPPQEPVAAEPAPAKQESGKQESVQQEPAKQQPASLLIDRPVRSGQSIVFVEGDITVLGSVGSGAEIIAGGSIHVYGALRGQAMAGATGDPHARIFCHRFEAELLAIGSHYRTADEIEESLRRGPAQAWLDGNTLKISAMN